MPPEYDPLITGLPTMMQAGEQALVNCTSDYSLPPATIDWFVDSEPQEVRNMKLCRYLNNYSMSKSEDLYSV